MSTFYVPDLGEGLTEARIVRWLVSVGDAIAVDQPVVEVETAKSVVEIPSPFAGNVTELHGADGDTVNVGSALISVEDTAEEYRRQEQAGSGNVLVGYGTAATAQRRHRRPRAAAKDSRGPLRVSSPLVRKIAREAGVDLHALHGSGPEGMIMRADVRQATERASSTAVPATDQDSIGQTRTAMSPADRAMAETLMRSRREIPEATVWVDVDFTELFDLRNRADPAVRISLLGYLARFAVAGLRQYPQLNGQLDEHRSERVTFDHVHLSVAVQTQHGLITPVVRNAHAMTTRELDTALSHLIDTARTGGAGDGGAGTFTLNNYGTLHVDGSAAIINYPQAAILGFGRIIDRPWAVNGELTIRKIGQMSFVFDHRVCDGGVAAGFMRTIADAIENPATAIASL